MMDKKYFYIRSTGFYWCKIKSNNSLEVCYWNGRYWELTGNENHAEDKELVINEEAIRRPLEKFQKTSSNNKENLLKFFHAIADEKDVEFFDSDKWILLSKGWEGMSELLFYIEEVSSNCENFRIKPRSKLVPFTFEDNKLLQGKYICRNGFTAMYKIIGIDQNGVSLIHSGKFKDINYNDLFISYCFSDGSLCGKYINE